MSAAPRIGISYSFLKSFSFEPKNQTNQRVFITFLNVGEYFLSYADNNTHSRDYRVKRTNDGWTIEEVYCSPTSFSPHNSIERVLNIKTIMRQQTSFGPEEMSSTFKLMEIVSVISLLFSVVQLGYLIYQRPLRSWSLGLTVSQAVLSTVCAFYLKMNFSNHWKYIAKKTALELMTLVDHAQRNSGSINDSKLLFSPKLYKA